MPLSIARNVSLRAHTTLELGGPAREWIAVEDDASLREAIAYTTRASMRWMVLGGGSNVVASDDGFDGAVFAMRVRGVDVAPSEGGAVRVRARAGESWSELVSMLVDDDLGGVECLAGIPGTVGATPIQNVGAYGVELADVVTRVRVFRPDLAEFEWIPRDACAFGYRRSRFQASREIVTDVEFVVRRGLAAPIRYAELSRALGESSRAPSIRAVHEAVLALRRSKSMVLDAVDPNRRSVGSFFKNPIVSFSLRDEIVARAMAAGIIERAEGMPCFAAGDGHVKLAAGWLVERAGFARGLRRHGVGVSTKHALQLVHHGSGTTNELVALAREIRAGVLARFGVVLLPEPSFVGFDADPLGQA